MNTFKDKSIRWPDKSAIKFTSAFQMQNQAQRKSWIIWSADFSLWTFHKTHLTDNTDEVLILQNMEVSIEGSPVHSANAQNVIEPSKIFLYFHSFFFFLLGSGCRSADTSCGTGALLPSLTHSGWCELPAVLLCINVESSVPWQESMGLVQVWLDSWRAGFNRKQNYFNKSKKVSIFSQWNDTDTYCVHGSNIPVINCRHIW